MGGGGAKSASAKTATAPVLATSVDTSSFPGANGKWPDNTKNHKPWSNSKDIWDEYGGGWQNGGVGGQQAKDMFKAVDLFTGPYYDNIRSAQQKGDTTSNWGEQGAKVEEFLAKGIATGNGWNGGTVYRGIGVDNQSLSAILNMNVGDPVDANFGGSASWSTKMSVAGKFGGGPNHVVFVNLDKSIQGVSVRGLAHYGHYEQEVLTSKDAKFTVAGIRQGTYGNIKQTFVYVHNA